MMQVQGDSGLFASRKAGLMSVPRGGGAHISRHDVCRRCDAHARGNLLGDRARRHRRRGSGNECQKSSAVVVLAFRAGRNNYYTDWYSLLLSPLGAPPRNFNAAGNVRHIAYRSRLLALCRRSALWSPSSAFRWCNGCQTSQLLRLDSPCCRATGLTS